MQNGLLCISTRLKVNRTHSRPYIFFFFSFSLKKKKKSYIVSGSWELLHPACMAQRAHDTRMHGSPPPKQELFPEESGQNVQACGRPASDHSLTPDALLLQPHAPPREPLAGLAVCLPAGVCAVLSSLAANMPQLVRSAANDIVQQKVASEAFMLRQHVNKHMNDMIKDVNEKIESLDAEVEHVLDQLQEMQATLLKTQKTMESQQKSIDNHRSAVAMSTSTLQKEIHAQAIQMSHDTEMMKQQIENVRIDMALSKNTVPQKRSFGLKPGNERAGKKHDMPASSSNRVKKQARLQTVLDKDHVIKALHDMLITTGRECIEKMRSTMTTRQCIAVLESHLNMKVDPVSFNEVVCSNCFFDHFKKWCAEQQVRALRRCSACHYNSFSLTQVCRSSPAFSNASFQWAPG